MILCEKKGKKKIWNEISLSGDFTFDVCQAHVHLSYKQSPRTPQSYRANIPESVKIEIIVPTDWGSLITGFEKMHVIKLANTFYQKKKFPFHVFESFLHAENHPLPV